MHDPGVFLDLHTVCFERALPDAPERVWQHLTEPELLAHWLGLALLEQRVGGRVELQLSDAIVSGTVLEYVPSQRFACSWHRYGLNDEVRGLVAFRLEARAAGTRLVLRHAVSGARVAAAPASEWHARLDALDARLRGEPPIDHAARVASLLPVYEARLPAK
ncbi:MAG TPA: SRPBCC domain-containing protein [Polyangiaceae bacterium]|nr:SRPBCC domain-containing protein [Polyangiaceae bacterium]